MLQHLQKKYLHARTISAMVNLCKVQESVNLYNVQKFTKNLPKIWKASHELHVHIKENRKLTTQKIENAQDTNNRILNILNVCVIQ